MKLFMKYTGPVKMKNKNYFLIALLLFTGIFSCFRPDAAFGNNLRTMFINNSAVIYALNIRTFGAKDYNKNDIIETELGEVKGTFINAIPKLKDLQQSGINTVYLLPITKVGKLHAHGTAGSLYALDSFDTINPQLFDESDLEVDIKKQAKKFVNAAHKLGMHVIADLPACGSYDMSLEKPELFLKDKKGETISPSDWTDVRLFKVYEDGTKNLNRSLINEHKKFINLVQEIGFDGIRVDVAAIKPYEFWKEIIEYARAKDSEFLFLAEASPNWDNPTNGWSEYLTINALLDAGFDGYYSDWSSLSDIKTNSDFFKRINQDTKILEKYNGKKSVMAAFATHDNLSPALLGYEYWQMVNWLDFLLPMNPYVLDGFPAADNYMYEFAGTKAEKSETDSDDYMTQKGMFDIKNFARAPKAIDSENQLDDFINAVKTRYLFSKMLITRDITELSTTNPSVFAFKKVYGDNYVIILGNLNKTNSEKADIKVLGLSKEDFVMPFKMKESPITSKNKLSVTLQPYEIQVYAITKNLSSKK